jgi:hypothetical protein
LQRKAIELEKRSGNYAAAMERLATLDAATRATAAWHIEMAELLQLSGQPDRARPHLAIAREQLAAGRPTGARMALQQQLELLESAPLAAN